MKLPYGKIGKQVHAALVAFVGALGASATTGHVTLAQWGTAVGAAVAAYLAVTASPPTPPKV